MMRFFDDPTWQFALNASFALLTIFVSVLIYRKQQSRRSITYKIITDTKIFSLRDEVKSRVKVFFDDKPVEKPLAELTGDLRV